MNSLLLMNRWKPVRLPSETVDSMDIVWYLRRPRWIPWRLYRWWKRLTFSRTTCEGCDGCDVCGAGCVAECTCHNEELTMEDQNLADREQERWERARLNRTTQRPDGSDRMPKVARLLNLFRYEDLPPHLQEVSKPCCQLAFQMADALPENTELYVGLNELLLAKENFVRALFRHSEEEVRPG